LAKYSIGKKLSSLLPKEPNQEEKLQARRELGIEGLPDGESLMNTATFSRVHIAAVLESRCLPDAAASADEDSLGEIILDEIAAEPPAVDRGQAAEIGRPANPAEVAALEREMMSAKDRDELAELALRIASYYARAAALFVVNRELVSGLRRAGEGSEVGIGAVMLPVEAESLVCRPVQTGAMVRGGPPYGEVDEHVLRALGRSHVGEILTLPIPVGDRIVGVLCVDNGEDNVPDTSVGALRVLALGAAEAYERLVVERRESKESETT